MIPLVGGLIMLLALFACAMFALERFQFEEELDRDLDVISAYRRGAMALRGEKLVAIAEAVAENPHVGKACLIGDRQALAEHAGPQFERLAQNSNITHIHFLDAERRTLLRMHDPTSFGDRIDRVGAREAERTGRPAVTVELGSTGSYTLRAVVPVTQTGKLVGYVELGEEILDSLLDLAQAFRLDAYVLLEKRYLERQVWEGFMRKLGRTPDWAHYPDSVIAARTRADLPGFLDELIARQGGSAVRQKDWTLEAGSRTYNVGILALEDAEGRQVGRLVLLRDVTALSDATTEGVIRVLLVSVLGGTLLGLFFWFHLGLTQRELAAVQAQVQDAAEARQANQRRHIEELTDRIRDLERFERLTVGRELRIQALKAENRRLKGPLDGEHDISSAPGADAAHDEGKGHGG